MNYRALGRTGWKVSEISFGAWAIGGSWGQVSDEDSMAALHQAIDCGVNFIDTADVYGNGRSERLIARLKKERKDAEIIVATKAGRRLPRQTVEGYSRAESFGLDRRQPAKSFDRQARSGPASLPADGALFDRPEVFGILDDLVKAGKIRYYGVSVRKSGRGAEGD